MQGRQLSTWSQHGSNSLTTSTGQAATKRSSSTLCSLSVPLLTRRLAPGSCLQECRISRFCPSELTCCATLTIRYAFLIPCIEDTHFRMHIPACGGAEMHVSLLPLRRCLEPGKHRDVGIHLAHAWLRNGCTEQCLHTSAARERRVQGSSSCLREAVQVTIVERYVRAHVEAGDVVCIAESVLAIMQVRLSPPQIIKFFDLAKSKDLFVCLSGDSKAVEWRFGHYRRLNLSMRGAHEFYVWVVSDSDALHSKIRRSWPEQHCQSAGLPHKTRSTPTLFQ